MTVENKLLFIFFCLCFLNFPAELLAQTDSLAAAADSVMTAESNEEVLQDYLIQTSHPFACRVFSALITQRDGYTGSMGRKDNSARVTHLTGGLQMLAKLNANATLGLAITGRRLMIHDRKAPITDIFKPDHSQNSETYLRYVIFQSRFNKRLNRNFLFISSNVLIPLNNQVEVILKNIRNQDPLFKQVNAQFIFYRRYSEHFSFNRGITATYRITNNPVNKLVMRGFLIPVFQHRISSDLYFTASAELNFLFMKPFLNNFYMNERAGFLYSGPFGILYSFQYGYYALGKNTNAQHSFNVSLKREFKTIPIRKLRAS